MGRGDEHTIAKITPYIRDEDVELARSVITVLSKVALPSDKRVVKLLCDSLVSKEAGLRDAAARALTQLIQLDGATIDIVRENLAQMEKSVRAVAFRIEFLRPLLLEFEAPRNVPTSVGISIRDIILGVYPWMRTKLAARLDGAQVRSRLMFPVPSCVSQLSAWRTSPGRHRMLRRSCLHPEILASINSVILLMQWRLVRRRYWSLWV